jgi:hypothetical protein
MPQACFLRRHYSLTTGWFHEVIQFTTVVTTKPSGIARSASETQALHGCDEQAVAIDDAIYF